MIENIKLPKNIRQMGMPGDKQKVYIEDYVYTYLHSFLKEKYRDDTLKAAVILGEYHIEDGTTFAFVKGAVFCDFSLLHEDMSEELSQTIRNYFSGWDMLGWYVSSQGVDAHIQSEIKHHYASFRAHCPQYLVYEDELEREIQVFAWEQNALHYLSGYYIYYEKNPRMQEFLIMEKGGRPQEMPTDRSVQIVQPQQILRDKSTQVNRMEKEISLEWKEDRGPLTESYRTSVSKSFSDMREILQDGKSAATSAPQKKMLAENNRERIQKESPSTNNYQERAQKKQAAENRGKKPQRVVYAACAAVLILLAAMGVSQIGNYQNLKQLQETISNTIIPVRNQETVQDSLSEEAPEQSSETEDASGQSSEIEQPSNIEETQEQLPEMEEAPEGDSSNQTVSSISPVYYTVKKGDSLYSISRAIYENENMVGPICELNGITNLHFIVEGQTLKLP